MDFKIMKGHIWQVIDARTGETFVYKRYECGHYHMRKGNDKTFKRVNRKELFKSLTKAHVRGGE